MNLSDSYLQQLQALHSSSRIGFGVKPPQALLDLINLYDPNTIIDYGCGPGNMIKSFKDIFPNKEFNGYDPAVDEFKTIPNKADLLYSTDVLEHFEPEFLDQGLANILELADIQYHYIACHHAKKTLPDGRNCHLVIENPRWWMAKFLEIMDNSWTILFSNSFYYIRKEKKQVFLEICLIKNVKIRIESNVHL